MYTSKYIFNCSGRSMPPNNCWRVGATYYYVAACDLATCWRVVVQDLRCLRAHQAMLGLYIQRHTPRMGTCFKYRVPGRKKKSQICVLGTLANRKMINA